MAKEYPTTIRLSRELKLQLKRAAKDEKRNISSQIRYVLDLWLRQRRPDPTTMSPPQAGEPQPGDA